MKIAGKTRTTSLKPKGLAIIAIIVTGYMLILLTSCGGKAAVKEEAFDPEKKLAFAEKQLKDEEYDEARKTLLEVKNRETSRKYAPLAQLKIADSYIKEGEPDLGIDEYKKFLELYPDNQYASYSQYQIAMAYFSQIESPDRGAGVARKALKEFERLKELYPRNPYKEAIELRIEKCKNVMADGELMTGQFYYKKEAYQSAINRLEGLLKQFPDYRGRDEVLMLMGRSYKALKNTAKSKEIFKKLIEAFPTSKLAAEAKKEL